MTQRDDSADAPKAPGGGCPFHEGSDDADREAAAERLARRAVDRRAFVRTALAIGGTGALSALSTGASARSPGELPVDTGRPPRGPDAERQFAWNRHLDTDPDGNVVLPTHQLLLFFEYGGSAPPTGSERRQVETAFRMLERAVSRPTPGDQGPSGEGLVSMVGYSPRYFDRFAGEGPARVDLRSPETVLEETDDDPAKADGFDAVVVLSSDSAEVLLAAEAALTGDLDRLNGVDVEATLEGVFEPVERRTAFVGGGLPREKLDMDEIHEEAPLSMGYKSGFEDNLASEDAVAITRGPFADGTILQVSKLRLDLGEWYDNDRATRDQLMFSHRHDPDRVGEVGEGLGADSGISEADVEDLESIAASTGRVGHAAKTAQARNDDFEPRILRRSEGVNNAFFEDGRVDFNFTAIMESTADFIETRQAMNSPDLDEYVDDGGHGILPYMTVTNRATFLVPPRRRRSLPMPRP